MARVRRSESISQQLNQAVYFAHLYSSWERGLNENSKGSSFKHIAERQVEHVMQKLNH